MNKKEAGIFLKEAARDTIALGGIAFFIIIIGRALIGPYWSFVYQLLLGFIIFLLIRLIIRDSDTKVAIACIIAVFTMLFYNEIRFTIFAVVILVLLILSAIYLKIKKKAILLGAVLGLISAVLSYYLVPIIAKYFNLPA